RVGVRTGAVGGRGEVGRGGQRDGGGDATGRGEREGKPTQGPDPNGTFSAEPPGESTAMLALLLLLLLVALFIGLGFVVKWLFILAIGFALVWLIGFFVRGAEARWYRW